jgi:predicted DNA-binding protein
MELWGISVETKENLKTLAKVKETPVSKMLEPVIEDYIHRHRDVLESRRI